MTCAAAPAALSVGEFGVAGRRLCLQHRAKRGRHCRQQKAPNFPGRGDFAVFSLLSCFPFLSAGPTPSAKAAQVSGRVQEAGPENETKQLRASLLRFALCFWLCVSFACFASGSPSQARRRRAWAGARAWPRIEGAEGIESHCGQGQAESTFLLHCMHRMHYTLPAPLHFKRLPEGETPCPRQPQFQLPIAGAKPFPCWRPTGPGMPSQDEVEQLCFLNIWIYTLFNTSLHPHPVGPLRC